MPKIKLKLGDVTSKKIITPNDFVSHMIEHVAWRLGVGMDLDWESENWYELGVFIGDEIDRSFNNPTIKDTVALGSIDDGAAKVKLSASKNPKVEISSSKNVDLELFKNSRCEQLQNSKPLEELLSGLADGLKIRMKIVVLNFKDPHHTWEGIFRCVGICLQKAFVTRNSRRDLASTAKIEKTASLEEISVLEKSIDYAKVRRETAESGVTIQVDFNGDSNKSSCTILTKDSISDSAQDASQLFNLLAKSMCARINIEFQVKALSSSHAVFEDIGLVLGRTLLEILKVRFDKIGAMGAGSSISSPAEFDNQNVGVCVSVDGRKFWDFIALDGDEKDLLENLIIGKNVINSIRSEDLDDFIDGLSGGLTSSIIILIKKISDPGKVWQEVFINLGRAIKEVFEINSNRQGVPPGVKATLS